jgi:hypothetical protein
MRPLAAILLLSLGFVGATISSRQSRWSSAQSIQLRGEVHRCDKSEGEIGRGLALRLVPDESGWNLEVGPKGTDLSLTLGNLKPNEQAWIESMKFEAEVSFRRRSKDAGKPRSSPQPGCAPYVPTRARVMFSIFRYSDDPFL